MRIPLKPRPAEPAFGHGKHIPEEKASILSRLFFSWLTPFLNVGFSRPLQHDDLWELPDAKRSAYLANIVEEKFYARCPPEMRPIAWRNSCTISTGEASKEKHADASGQDTAPSTSLSGTTDTSEPEQKYDCSVPKALFLAFRGQIVLSGILKLVAETLRTTSPLITRVFLEWLTASYAFHRLSDAEKADAAEQGRNPQGVGFGIGVVFGLFMMQELASLIIAHFMLISMGTGLCVRTALIGTSFRKSLRLSGKARLVQTTGRITNLISTDVSKLDRFANVMHDLWIAPIQLAIGIGLLIGTLGYSALVGVGVLVLGIPIQVACIKIMVTQRRKGVKITDQRLKSVNEILQGIRLVKSLVWEDFYTFRVETLRRHELKTIKNLAFARGGLFSLIMLIPVLASSLSFITYALSGHPLDVAIVFSALQLFNVIRTPLTWLPISLGIFAESLIAFKRVKSLMTADELTEPYPLELTSEYAVSMDADFTWEDIQAEPTKDQQSKTAQTSSSANQVEILPSIPSEEIFELKDMRLEIRKGSFVAIVGKVGSGKSSLVQAMLGEMRKTRGDVTLGGSVAYVPQSPWIRNLTLRDNITFGLPFDENRFNDVIRACCLEQDLEMLPQSEDTEIGEKGINISGGQKARVALARAAYSQSDIVLLDDSLSAVDAYVGKAILENCLLNGPLRDRTRILVTHSLPVLSKADYIYVLNEGKIAEQGTYSGLTAQPSLLARLLQEYGSDENAPDTAILDDEAVAPSPHDAPEKQASEALMQTEERVTGAVTWATYTQFLRHAGSIAWGPFVVIMIVSLQASAVATNLVLGFWTGSETGSGLAGFSQGHYIALYAALGMAGGVMAFITTCGYFLMCLQASSSLFKAAWAGVVRSPVSFFDTTPMGRILTRFSKDLDVVDKEIAIISLQAIFTFSSIWGTVFLVFWTFPLLGIIFAPMIVLYYSAFLYYRRSSVETKRLDSLARSTLYATFSETLTGLSTVRAYNLQNSCVESVEERIYGQNKAYYVTIAIQRWLSVRLDLLANFLILGIGLFAVGFRESMDPSRIGVVLTYTLNVTASFADMVTQAAQTEQSMNAVERLHEYATLPSEGDAVTPNDPPAGWPKKGAVEFRDVELAYRPNLPLVLKGVSFAIRDGEKVGIVGRTGAGKSSLLQALFRMVELQSGQLFVDDVDIRNIGLSTLRNGLALVPQDSVLFRGTIRDNIDPLNQRTDAELISILRRCWLLPTEGAEAQDPTAELKFRLDAVVGDDGSNYSAGQRQLLALARALAKDSRIIVLDEATSSVDVETDSKVQLTMKEQFSGCTLLCIAHRLNTIANYDRILVMDAGKVAEFDTVLNLFDENTSIFRSLCDEANLTRADILRIRGES